MKGYNKESILEYLEWEMCDTCEVGMREDWYWTAESLTLEQVKEKATNEQGNITIAGISASDYATPIILVNGMEYEI